MVIELLEVLGLPLHRLDPIGSIDAQDRGDIEAGPVDRVDRRRVPDVRLLRLVAPLAEFDIGRYPSVLRGSVSTARKRRLSNKIIGPARPGRATVNSAGLTHRVRLPNPQRPLHAVNRGTVHPSPIVAKIFVYLYPRASLCARPSLESL